MYGKQYFRHNEEPKDRPGYVYIAKVVMTNRIWNHKEDLYKIGCSIDPEKRVSNLCSIHGIQFDLITASWAKDRFLAERIIHWQFLSNLWSPQMEYKYACWWPEEFFLFDEDLFNIAKLEIVCFRHGNIKRASYYRLSEGEMITKTLKNKRLGGIHYPLLKFRH